MIKAGIVGGAGYTGGELIRILKGHPEVEITFVHSNSQANKAITDIHTDLMGETELVFTNSPDFSSIDVIFICSGHGQSKVFLESTNLPESLKIIDLSTDFRPETNGFVYGLPELQREKVKNSTKIANPGCFATSIQLALLPLAKNNLINSEIHVSAVTGSTGAGQALSKTGHFSWRNSNISVYKAFTHQHLTEIKASLVKLQADVKQDINFIPYRGNFTRGIMANVYTAFTGSQAEAVVIFKEYYKDHPFINVTENQIDLKMVVNTNKNVLQVQVLEGKILITSIIDNLIKGASGQAVQNMNLLFGLPETEGLNLKPTGF